MVTIILIAVIIFLWTLGGLFVTLVTGWEINKLNDFIKIIFWPISIFISKK